MRFIFHSHGKYTHRSAGIKALYKLANEVQLLGHDVTVAQSFENVAWAAIPWVAVAASEYDIDPCPYDLEIIEDKQIKSRLCPPESGYKRPENFLVMDEDDGAVHVYTDRVWLDVVSGVKTVRWLLNRRPAPLPVYDEIEVSWVPNLGGRQRLCLDIIEHELFFPKWNSNSKVRWADRGGIVHYVGKAREIHEEDRLGKEITWEWPTTRAELADVLRQADVLVSFDVLTQIIIEARLCGTPVVIPPYVSERMLLDKLYVDGMYGKSGVAVGWEGLPEAMTSVSKSQDEYRLVCKEIQDDVPKFIELLEHTWP